MESHKGFWTEQKHQFWAFFYALYYVNKYSFPIHNISLLPIPLYKHTYYKQSPSILSLGCFQFFTYYK